MFHVGEFPSTIDNGGRVALGVRPEHLRVVPNAQARFTIAVQMIRMGRRRRLRLMASLPTTRIICRLDNATSVKVGDRLPLSFDPMRVHWFDAETGSGFSGNFACSASPFVVSLSNHKSRGRVHGSTSSPRTGHYPRLIRSASTTEVVVLLTPSVSPISSSNRSSALGESARIHAT